MIWERLKNKNDGEKTDEYMGEKIGIEKNKSRSCVAITELGSLHEPYKQYSS